MKKRGRKIQINFTNRWLYTFIAIGILAAIGVGVYAATYSPSGAGHPYTEISTCSANQILKMNSAGNAWTCNTDTRCDTSGTCSQVCIGTNCRTSWTAPNYLHNYSTQNEIFDLLSPSIPNAGNKIPVNGGAPIGTWIWVFSYAERVNVTTIYLGGSRYSFSESSLGISRWPITDGITSSGSWISITW